MNASANQVSVHLPDNPVPPFLHYTVYYRIYISDLDLANNPVESTDQFNYINPLLYEDYLAFKRYTDNENLTPSSTLFSGRHYFKLELALNNNLVDTILSSGLPATVAFDFLQSVDDVPSLIHSGVSYYLYRSKTGLDPQPPSTSLRHRLFQNTDDLNSSANAFQPDPNTDPNKNRDVADKAGISSFRYTYVSLYIMAEGIDNHYSPIYSRPVHIGVFRLPNVSG
jgi:hypothetical protein